MGLSEIPHLDLSSKNCKGGWGAVCKKARESCEEHGCFILLNCDQVPTFLREKAFAAVESLFDLPEETKVKHRSRRPYSGYSGNSAFSPLRESFGVDNAAELDSARAFTGLMWPNGNPSFCGTINSMSSEMLELNVMVLRMILEGLGLEKYHNSLVENSVSVFRLTKYSVPPNRDSNIDSVAVGLAAHTDKEMLTVLCQNDVQGLEVLSKEGRWNKVTLPQGSFIVFVGDLLRAWSNGRLQAATHRVVVAGDSDRYSCGLFLAPKDGIAVEVPGELVDDDHPLLYRPFTYIDYVSYFKSNSSPNALDMFARVQ